MRWDRPLAALVILLLAAPAQGAADFIGIFADSLGTHCELTLTAQDLDTLYILAVIPDLGDSGITAAEFAIDGLPTNGAQGFWLAEWSTDLVIGDPEYGIALAFPAPLTGERVQLGRILMQPLAGGWVGANHELDIVPPLYFGDLSLVTHDYQEVPVSGTGMVLNCSTPAACPCQTPGCDLTPALLDFGIVGIGSWIEKSFTLTNTSDDTFSGSLVSPEPAFRFVAGGGDFTLPIGHSHSATLRFEPTEWSDYTATILTGCECLGPLCVGIGAPPCAVLPSSDIALGPVALGDYLDGSFTVNRPLGTGSSLHLQISEASEHISLLAGGGSVNVMPGGSHTVRYRYHPMSVGETTSLIALGNAACTDVTLRGEGFIPEGSHVLVDHIGLYENPNASGCGVRLPLWQTRTLELLAVIPSFAAAGVREASFRIHALPESGGDPPGTVTVDWGAGATIISGNLWDGVTVRYDPPRAGHFANLARVSLRALDVGWAPEDLAVVLAGTAQTGEFTLIDGEGIAHLPLGATHLLNCSDPLGCDCGRLGDPACAFWPPSLDFGLVAVGASADSSFVVRNSGGGSLTGVIAAACPDFSILEGAGAFLLCAGEAHAVRVRFTPAAVGTSDCVLSTGLETCDGFVCRGVGNAPPLCVLEPDSLDFGEIPWDETEEQSFFLRNAGGGLLTGEIGQPAGPHFSVVAGGGPFSLGLLESRLVRVRFAPTAPGYQVDAVPIVSEFCSGPLPLIGRARPEAIYPDILGVYADSAATRCDLDLQVGAVDTSSVVLTCPAFAESGITGVAFRLANLPPNGAGGSWWAEWNAPLVSGNLETGLTLRYDEPQIGGIIALGRLFFSAAAADWAGTNWPITVAPAGGDSEPRLFDEAGLTWSVGGGGLILNCEAPANCDCPDTVSPICRLEPAALDFGELPVFHSLTLSFTVTNDGFGLLAGELGVSGTGFTLLTGGGPFSLGPGESLTGSVRFTPLDLGTFAGTVTTGLADCPTLPLTGRSVPSAHDVEFLGAFADLAAIYCYADIGLHDPVRVHFMACIRNHANYQLTGARFRIAGIPRPTAAQGRVAGYPRPGVYATGDLWDGVNLSIYGAPYGMTIPLFDLEFEAYQPGWIGEDDLLTVVGAFGETHPELIFEWGAIELSVQDGWFTFNCSSSYYCTCHYEDWPQAVLLTDFALVPTPGTVDIHWELESDGPLSCRLEAEQAGTLRELSVPVPQGGAYALRDADPVLHDGGEVTYTLHAREGDGDWQILRRETATVPALPRRTGLGAPHPNPFNPTVRLPFSLRATGQVRLAIVDVSGRRVAQLIDAEWPAGEHALEWNGRDDSGRSLSAGVYFVEFRAPGCAQARKLVLLR